MDLIKIKNLNFSYPAKKDTLKNINLKIEKGSFTCIVGENGSGKSTLLKCILGLNKGYIGEITKTSRIGYLPQKSEIQSNFPASIEEVVLSGTISNNINSIFYKKDDKEKAIEKIDSENTTKYKENADKYIAGIKDVDSKIQNIVDNKKRREYYNFNGIT